jgi:hypothetical protein
MSICKVNHLPRTSINGKEGLAISAASAELAKWHNIVDKGFCQAPAIVDESTRQLLSPQGRDPLDMGFRLDFACADACQVSHKPSFASLCPVN